MKTLNLYDAKTQLSRLVDEAQAGEDIIICKNGKPMARLVRFTETVEAPRFGALAGSDWRLPDDFDAPSPDIDDMFHPQE